MTKYSILVISFKTGAYFGLGLIFIAPILAWNGNIDLEFNEVLLLAGTVTWFGFAPPAFLKRTRDRQDS